MIVERNGAGWMVALGLHWKQLQAGRPAFLTVSPSLIVSGSLGAASLSLVFLCSVGVPLVLLCFCRHLPDGPPDCGAVSAQLIWFVGWSVVWVPQVSARVVGVPCEFLVEQLQCPLAPVQKKTFWCSAPH
jgi:hypothetical protein